MSISYLHTPLFNSLKKGKTWLAMQKTPQAPNKLKIFSVCRTQHPHLLTKRSHTTDKIFFSIGLHVCLLGSIETSQEHVNICMFKIVSWFSWININNNESFVKWDSEKSLQVTLAFRAGQRVLKCCPLFIKSPQVHNRYQIRIAHTHSDYSSLYGITAYTMHPSRSFSKQWNWNLAYQLCQSSKILIWGQIQVYAGIRRSFILLLF